MTFNTSEGNLFGEINFNYFVFYVTVFILLTLTIVIGNAVVIVTILRHEDLQQPCNHMIASLAASDLMFGILFPIYNLGQLRNNSVTRLLVTSNMCRSLITLLQWIEMNSAYHLVAITINRYIAITRPLKYHVYLTKKRAVYSIGMIWLTTLVTSVSLYTTTVKTYDPSEYPVCLYEMMFSERQSILMAFLTGIIPLTALFFLYAIIARIARKHIRDIAVCSGSFKLGKAHVLRHEIRSTLMISLLVGYFAFAWVPFLTYIVYQTTCQCSVSSYIRLSSRMLVYTNYAINIFVYAGRLHLFRKFAIKDIRLCCLHCKKLF